MPRRRSRRPFRLVSLLTAAVLALSAAAAAGVVLATARRPTRVAYQPAAVPLALPALRVTPTATPTVPPPPRDGDLQDAEVSLRDDPVYLPLATDSADTSAMETVVQGAGGGLYVAQLPAGSVRSAGTAQQLVDRLCYDLALTGYQPNPTCVIRVDQQLWLSSAVLSVPELNVLRRQALSRFPDDPESALGVLAASLGTELGALRGNEANAAATTVPEPEPVVLAAGIPHPELVKRGLLAVGLVLLLWRAVAVRIHAGRHC
jgi:hypothetical protein